MRGNDLNRMPLFPNRGIGCLFVTIWLLTGAIALGMLGGIAYLVYYVFNSPTVQTWLGY